MAPPWLTTIRIKCFGLRRLPGANLSGANLAGANLAEADLTQADLTGAILIGANLTRVYGADFTGSIM